MQKKAYSIKKNVFFSISNSNARPECHVACEINSLKRMVKKKA